MLRRLCVVITVSLLVAFECRAAGFSFFGPKESPLDLIQCINDKFDEAEGATTWNK